MECVRFSVILIKPIGMLCLLISVYLAYSESASDPDGMISVTYANCHVLKGDQQTKGNFDTTSSWIQDQWICMFFDARSTISESSIWATWIGTVWLWWQLSELAETAAWYWLPSIQCVFCVTSIISAFIQWEQKLELYICIRRELCAQS